jgi:crotonobetainyl-CoA:carnitine CoA-transferase CaiB-like acyl-CoA transferase
MKSREFREKVRDVVENAAKRVVAQEVAAVAGYAGVPMASLVAASSEYVDDRDLAARTPLSRVTWQTMRARRAGPPFYKIGRRCFYKWLEVQQWLEEHRTEPKAKTKKAS